MALTLYGSPHSRTQRVLWMATELELEFEHVPWAFDDPRLKTAEYLQMNPAGAMPTLVDGDLVLSESLAINLYLARTYGGESTNSLYPTEATLEPKLVQWSLWVQGHIEPWVQKDAILQPAMRAVRTQLEPALDQSLATLERALGGTGWLVAERFTVADLNVAAVLSPSRAADLRLVRFPRLQRWLADCYARPACRAARRRYGQAPA